ncbi:MAG: NifB/NifX family molybdenum-iron cluster-binding protein [Sphaerochaetaceae bacterium]|nr:NifB/NifX family molybdenum-iron cluster-binding protein [Sphaerochaetaceae bacterium]MDC7247629.1 NifB/NifX family molybdenum-iron cluster-binding protein [Sphaerochaetaceae bacterium]
MRRIAVAADNNTVSGHFGLSEEFIYFDTEGETVTNIERVHNPGHRPTELPEKVMDHKGKIDTIIAGRLGKEAAKIFEREGVEIIIGAEGEPEHIIDSYIRGELHSKGEFCDAWMCEFFF